MGATEKSAARGNLKGVARFSVLGNSVTVGACIDFASTLFTSNVPNARNGVAVLTFTKTGTTTTVVEVDESVNAFVITTDQTGDGASREALRARSNGTRAELALLNGEAFVPFAVVTIFVSSVVIVVVTVFVSSVAIVVVIITVFVSGFFRRRRWVGWVGRSRVRVAAEGAVGPTPTRAALGRRGVIARLIVRSAATDVLIPRPSIGAVFAVGWVARLRRTSILETTVFTRPLELTIWAITSSACKNEGKGQSQKKDARNERHVEK